MKIGDGRSEIHGNNARFVWVHLLRAFLICGLLTCAVLAVGDPLPNYLTDVSTDKSRYAPGTPVTFSVTVTNPSPDMIRRGTVHLGFTYLATALKSPPSQSVMLPPGSTQVLRFVWKPPVQDYRGYLVRAQWVDSKGRVIETKNSVVDISSSWLRFPRFGYLTTFGRQSAQTSRDEVRGLRAYHLNSLQFYDWQYKHHLPLAGSVSRPAPFWKDLASTTEHPKLSYRETVLGLIAASHAAEIACMNYNLLYGAWSGYAADGVDPKWGLYKDRFGQKQDSIPLPASWQTSLIYLFNPADLRWQEHLFRQERNLFAAYPFDGWHVDQVGNRGDVFDASGKPIPLNQTFALFLNRAEVALHKTILFNNVGAFGLENCAKEVNSPALYIECWEGDGQKTYNDLKQVIDRARTESNGRKSVILAAYMNKAYAEGAASPNPKYFNLPGILLTDATIFASGGSHIELGDHTQMLCTEYFPNHNLQLTENAKIVLRRYYDFLVAYENLLRDTIRDNQNRITLSSVSSQDAKPQSIWSFARTTNQHHVLHFINLIGEKSNLWRDANADYPEPETQTNITVRYYCGNTVFRSVHLASPDNSDIGSVSLAFHRGTDAQGKFVTFTIPRLKYWDMVYFSV